MKPIRCLYPGSRLKISDNSGVKEVEIISFKKKTGGDVRKRRSSGGLGDICSCAMKKGVVKFKKKILSCLIVQQKVPFKKKNGERYLFRNNLGILLLEDTKKPIATKINCFVPVELKEFFPKVVSISRGIIF